ncbi:MAG: DciA family protein [Gammaproteobacteria bacterium SHHR-1]|uniref:DciA family protein n=1 Tax=Magnetovirga frankeli TaxID=947516 RepID=UPI001293EFC9|nr:DUF721 domain-containing protein [gamma proteobacterium SS-5]
MKPRTLADWLRKAPGLKGLVNDCQQQLQLLQLVRSRLPDPLCDHCCSASLNGSQLVLGVDSPAWSGRLRLLQGRLKLELGQLDMPIQQVKVVVIPQSALPRPPLRPAQEALSRHNAQLIQSLAEQVENPQLKQSLGRLARHRSGQ